VEETLNGLLAAEADQLCGARKYERAEGRKDIRVGSYERQTSRRRFGDAGAGLDSERSEPEAL
jgi:transposase-like protein